MGWRELQAEPDIFPGVTVSSVPLDVPSNCPLPLDIWGVSGLGPQSALMH
jgi:hypothetical protein